MPNKSSELIPKSRRAFVKVFAASMAYSFVGERDWFGRLVGEVRAAEPDLGSLLIRISDFPALNTDLGSVRIGTSAISANFPKGLLYPILINRASPNQFHVLSSECTHASCVVGTFSKSGNSSVCPCHGSRFRIDGTRAAGPAAENLTKFDAEYDGVNTLRIRIPDFPLKITATVTQSGIIPPSRLRLEFLGFAGIDYQVYFRPTILSEWRTVSFAILPEGPLNSVQIAGRDDFATVFVENTEGSGFYAVAMKTRTV